ncbi:MAG TPA: alpha/beta hydrolase [Mycobacteriales bacterium]|nr:alpha/beta hydrolase [Mycobacteriales bacterium]
MRRFGVLIVAVLLLGLAQTPAGAASSPWSPCADSTIGAQCRDIPVPLDYADPHGRTISLHVSRLAATGHRIGTLFFNPGGPGGPGAETVAEYGDQYFPAALRRSFDIIGFDPRGTGQSAPVACGGPTLLPDQHVFPHTVADYARMLAQSRSYGRQCLANSPRGLLPHIDTVSAARDIDAVRAALGERTISYLGLSYGTFLGQTYARLFPHRVRAMVLDGALDHATDPRRFLLDEAGSLEQVFTDFTRWCAGTASCALHGQDVMAAWDRLLARADRTPIHAANGPVTGDAIRMTLPNLLLFGPTSLLGNEWQLLAAGIQEALAGEATTLQQNSSVGIDDAAYTAITCQDFPSDLAGYGDVRLRMAITGAVAPHTGGASEAWKVTAACSDWPVPASDPWAPVRVTGAPPILIAASDHDPSTPLVWAQRMQREISGSVLLRAEVEGHTAYLNSTCAVGRETAYLISGRLPSDLRCD